MMCKCSSQLSRSLYAPHSQDDLDGVIPRAGQRKGGKADRYAGMVQQLALGQARGMGADPYVGMMRLDLTHQIGDDAGNAALAAQAAYLNALRNFDLLAAFPDMNNNYHAFRVYSRP